MGNPLFDRRSAREFAAAGLSVDFKEKLPSFDRLAAAVENDLSALDDGQIPVNWRESSVSGELVFGFAAQQPQAVTLTGRVDATVDAVCQRSLEPFSMPLSTELKVLLQAPGEDTPDLDDFDVWELEEVTFRPVDIVDEALVMAMPMIARDDAAEDSKVGEPQAELAKETTRPFADLREQMDREGNEG